jgi:hypothetical protein
MKSVMPTAALVVFALAACGGKSASDTTPAQPSDDPVVELTRLKDRLCACDTTDCAAKVGEQLNALGERQKGAPISDAQLQQAQAANAEIDRCMARITGAPEDERTSPSDN